MYKVKCKCGQSEKSFKFDIGEFFISECCEKAGYDNKGMRAEDYEAEAEELANEILGDVDGDGDVDEQDLSIVHKEYSAAQAEEESEPEESLMEPQVEAAMASMEEELEQEVKPDFEEMTAKQLMAYCEENGIDFSKRDTKKKLLARLK